MRFYSRSACVLTAVFTILTAPLFAQTLRRPTIDHVTFQEVTGILTVSGNGLGPNLIVTVGGQQVAVLPGAISTQFSVEAPTTMLTTPGTYRLTVTEPGTRASDVFEVVSYPQSNSAIANGAFYDTAAPELPASQSVFTVGAPNQRTSPGAGVMAPSLWEDFAWGNTGLGIGAFASNVNGRDSTAIGYQSIATAKNANNLTAVGTMSLASNTEGLWNTAVGRQSMRFNTLGSFNTAVGVNSMLWNTTGGNNVALGRDAMYANTSGSNNTSAGSSALSSNSTGDQNTAIGSDTLPYNTTGGYNTAVGHGALNSNTTGGENTAVGRLALGRTTVGNFNAAVGEGALYGNIGGANNVALGLNAGFTPSHGSWNIFLGANVTGEVGDTNTMRLGGNSVRQTFVSGIFGTQLSGDVRFVLIDAKGRMGTFGAFVPAPGVVVPGNPGNARAAGSRPAELSTQERRELDAQRVAIAELRQRIDQLEAVILALRGASPPESITSNPSSLAPR